MICSEAAVRTDSGQVLAVDRRALPDWSDVVLAQTPQVQFTFGDCQNGRSSAPPSLAEETARTLPNARLLVFPGVEHGIVASSAPCFERDMWSFLDTPDATCVDAFKISPFALP